MKYNWFISKWYNDGGEVLYDACGYAVNEDGKTIYGWRLKSLKRLLYGSGVDPISFVNVLAVDRRGEPEILVNGEKVSMATMIAMMGDYMT